MNKLLRDVSNAEYYSQSLSDTPMLTYSTASLMIGKSPLHAHKAHAKLGNKQRRTSEAMEKGKLFDAVMTGQEDSLEVVQILDKDGAVIDAPSLQSNQAKQVRAAIEARGHQAVMRSSLNTAIEAAAEIRRSLLEEIDPPIDLDCCDNQVTALWVDKTSCGQPVQCCGRFDLLDLQRATIYDVKRTRYGQPMSLRRDIERYHYNIQRTAYTRALETIYPELGGRVRFINIFCEVDEPPYVVTPILMAGTQLQLGERLWQRAIDLWHRCLTEDRWPGYVTHVLRQEASPWALKNDIAEQYESKPDMMDVL